MNTMNLKTQTSVLKPYLLLVKTIILVCCLISCKQEKKRNLISSEQEKSENLISSQNKNSVNEIYNGRKIIKEVTFKNNNKTLKSVFLLKEEGELGTKGFTKELEVLIFNKDFLIDSFSFKNKSALCGLKIFTDEIKVLSDNNNQILFFPIIHSYGGEEPNFLIVNTWDGKMSNYKINIPVYFQDTESKTKFSESVLLIDFKSNQIRANVYNLIKRETKIDLSEIKIENTSKIDRQNPKYFTKSDISKIRIFFASPTEDIFFNSFYKEDNLKLNVFIDFLTNEDCLDKCISYDEIKDCMNQLKCEVYCSYDVTQEDIDDGEFSEEIMYVYFNKINGKIFLNKIEFRAR